MPKKIMPKRDYALWLYAKLQANRIHTGLEFFFISEAYLTALIIYQHNLIWQSLWSDVMQGNDAGRTEVKVEILM